MFDTQAEATVRDLAALPPLPDIPATTQRRRWIDELPLSKRTPKTSYQNRTSSRERTDVEVASTPLPLRPMPRSRTTHCFQAETLSPELVPPMSTHAAAGPPLAHATRKTSNSFQIPQFPDMSLIKDCSIGGVSADETFDFGIDKLRSVSQPLGRDLGVSPVKDDYAVRRGISPSVSSGDLALGPKIGTKESSPARRMPKSSTVSNLQDTRAAATSSDVSRSGSIRRFADLLSSVKARQTSSLSQPSPSTRSKRTFPASSSGQSLASVGEEPGVYEMAIRTPLPSSPSKKHLDDDVLEVLAEGQYLPPSPARHGSSRPASRMPSPVRQVKHPLPADTNTVHAGDVSLDINALMSRMTKPKRASGTEESFVDLLHDNESFADVTMLGANESFLPASIVRTREPPSASAKSVEAKRKSHLQNSPSKVVVQSPPAPDPIQILEHPALDQKANISHLDKAGDHELLRGLARSKSHTRMTSTEAALSTVKDPSQPMTLSPFKTLAATPREQRHRSGLQPPSSRRISLSAGAVPLKASASHKILNLPTPRMEQTKAAETHRSATQTIDRDNASALKPSSARLFTLPQPRPPTISPSKMSAPASATARPRRPSALPSSTVGSARFSMAPRTMPTVPPPSTTTRPPMSRPTTFRPTFTVSRTAALPRHGSSSATSLSQPSTTASREFGKDATSATNNRLPLPSSRPAAPASGRVKLSMEPSSPSKRIVDPKTRGLSMPPTVSASRAAASASVPALPSLRTTSTHARSVARIPAEMKRASTALPTSSSTSSRAVGSKTGSTSSRVRTDSTAGSARSGAGSSTAESISAIRARLGEIEARRRVA